LRIFPLGTETRRCEGLFFCLTVKGERLTANGELSTACPARSNGRILLPL